MSSKYKLEDLPEVVEQLNDKIDKLLERTNQHQEAREEDELLTVDQCAEFLHMSKHTIYGLRSKREIPSMKRGKMVYFRKSHLLEWLERGRNKTNDEIDQEADDYLNK